MTEQEQEMTERTGPPPRSIAGLALGVLAVTSVVAALTGASIFSSKESSPRTIGLDLEVHEAPAPLVFTSDHPHWDAQIDGVTMPIEVVPSDQKSELRVFLDGAPEGLGRIELSPLDAPDSAPEEGVRSFAIPYERQLDEHSGGTSPVMTQVGQGLVKIYMEELSEGWENKARASLPEQEWCGVGFTKVSLGIEWVDGRMRTKATLLGSRGLEADLTIWPEARITQASKFVLQIDPKSLELDINTPRFVSDGTTVCDTLASTSEVLPWMLRPILASMKGAASTMIGKFDPIELPFSFRTRAGPLQLTHLGFKPRHLELEGHLDLYGEIRPSLKEPSGSLHDHQEWLGTLPPLAPNSVRVSAPLDVVNALLGQIATGETSREWFEARYPDGIALQNSLLASNCQLDAPLHVSRADGSLMFHVPLARCQLTVKTSDTQEAPRESQWYIFFSVDAPVQAGHDRLLWRWSTSTVEPLCAPASAPDRIDRCDVLQLEQEAFIRALTRMLPASTPLDELTNPLMPEGANVNDANDIRLWSERSASGWVVFEFDWENSPRALVDALERHVR